MIKTLITLVRLFKNTFWNLQDLHWVNLQKKCALTEKNGQL